MLLNSFILLNTIPSRNPGPKAKSLLFSLLSLVFGIIIKGKTTELQMDRHEIRGLISQDMNSKPVLARCHLLPYHN